MGDLKRKETLEGFCALLKRLKESQKNLLIAGGDSVAAATTCDSKSPKETYSTGGGATLAYLSGQTLPGLDALK